jgi:hypothetical protein
MSLNPSLNQCLNLYPALAFKKKVTLVANSKAVFLRVDRRVTTLSFEESSGNFSIFMVACSDY